MCKTCCCVKELENSHNRQNCLCLGTECISCHRVLPPYCFEGEQRCKACTKKLNGEKRDIREVIDDLHITINSYNDWETILTERKQEIQQFLYKNVLIHKVIKYNITISVEFMKETSNQTKYQIAYFNSPPYIYNVTNVLDTSFLNQYFSKKIDDFNQNGSGWIYNKLAHIQVNVIKYKPIKGSTYFPLPSFISNKKSCINVKNNDDKCFLWSVIAAFHPAPFSRERVSHYKQYEYLYDCSSLEFPLAIDDIYKFENLNNISINTILYEGNEEKGDFVPIYASPSIREKHVNLLLITNENTFHYCLIDNMSRLLSSSQSADTKQKYFCFHCLHGFRRKELLEEHEKYCHQHKLQKTVLPIAPNNIMKFSKFSAMQRSPFIIYCDFESMLIPSEDAIQEHKPMSFCYHVVSDVPQYKDFIPYVYKGEDVIKHFINKILEEEIKIMNIMNEIIENPAQIIMSSIDITNFNGATTCYLCENAFTPENYKVRDHCHITSRYRGAACNNCNRHVRFTRKFKIPIFFHNGGGYDFHLILKDLYNCSKIKVIPRTVEKYLCIEISDNLIMKDSFNFLSTSLEKLVENLKDKGNDNFIHMKKQFSTDYELLLKKGVYPYDWVDSLDKLSHDGLPEYEQFYSLLNDANISENEYKYAQSIYEYFQCNNFGDYHNIYLISDVLLLADVFESFRLIAMNIFQLDPAYFLTLPSFGWEAMLKVTQVQLELLTEENKYLFFENGIRGGISSIMNRHAIANNKYMNDFDESKPSSYIIYLDKNSLYPEAMQDLLPHYGFEWCNKVFDEASILAIPANNSIGYIFEVDLEYPAYLHDEQNEYPLAVDYYIPTKNDLSPFNSYLQPKYIKTKKLTPTLYNRQKYIVHYRNLQFYLKNGMKLVKVYKIMEFIQTRWMEKYIETCVYQRKISTSSFDKDFFKLMMNSVFGKTMENVRKHTNVDIVDDVNNAMKRVAKPLYKRYRKINDSLLAIEMNRFTVNLTKPVYAGQAILDLSKLYMYQFHYDHLKKKYPNAKLLFTDTDSLCYHIHTEDIYSDMKADGHMYDFSSYNERHICYSTKNKKVIGKWKDETDGLIIKEFIGLRPKLYSIKCCITYDPIKRKFINQRKKALKGVKKNASSKIHHTAYYKTLLKRTLKYANFHLIKSNNHCIQTVNVEKVALSAFDDKRYILQDGISTMAYGHSDIEMMNILSELV